MSDIGWVLFSDLTLLILAVSLFVAGHELLSHPLRAPLVRLLGDKGFMVLYALLALGSLGWAGELWKRIPPDRLWQVPNWTYPLAAAVMLLAFMLFVGSVSAPNPALMGGEKAKPGVRGAQGITRHPMMWAFALWAIVHMAMSADSRTLVLAGGILVLALLGSAMQDRKKLASQPGYDAHVAATSFLPFGRILTGAAPLASAWPGAVAVLGGLALWAGMLFAHPWLIGVSPFPY